MKITLQKVFIIKIHAAKLQPNFILMEQTTENDKLLAHWVYGKEEWSRFTRWRMLKKGIGHFILYFLHPPVLKKGAEVKIGSTSVYIYDNRKTVYFSICRFLHVEIYDAGEMNILEIKYSKTHGTGSIRIPVPKGKLKDAVIVEDKLQQLIII